jgi:hypothetical protein
MTVNGRLRSLGILLVLILTVATGALGFAHRPPSADHEALVAYVLAGGNPADICGDSDGDGLADHGCPACHLTGSALVPDPAETLYLAEYRYVARVIAPRESRAVRAVLDPALGLRAPPLA